MTNKKQYFKYQLNLGILLLAIFILIAAFGSILWTIYQMIVDNFTTILIIQYTIVLTITTISIAFAITILFFTKYTITNTAIILYFGFIPKKYPLQKIMAIKWFKQKNKLLIYHTLNSNQFSVISIAPQQFTPFVQNLLQQNKQIIYEEISQIIEDDAS